MRYLATGLCGDDAAQFGRVVAFGDFDGGDHVIADDGGRVGIDDAAAGVDHDESAVNADGGEHGGEQGGFVFAVAVTIAEDVAGVVGLVAADAQSR